MEIRFYKEFGPLGYLASYSPHGFYKDGIYWKTVEHYYQAQKFEDETIRKKIIDAPTPKMASIIGRDRRLPLRKNWKKIKKNIMYNAVYYKFRSHPDIAKKLLETGNKMIVEETVKENYWGCGPKGDGENNFGIILCKVREALRTEFHGEEYMMYYISQNGYDKLYQDYLAIDNEIMEINKKIGESVERDNDLRENQEFMNLRVKAMYELPKKKETLWRKYQNAIIIENTEEYRAFDGTTVIIGCSVDIDFNGDECTYTILGTDEGDIDEDILSCDAPISKAMLGKHLGDKIIFNGECLSILNIRR